MGQNPAPICPKLRRWALALPSPIPTSRKPPQPATPHKPLPTVAPHPRITLQASFQPL
ncbi:hypothetical protein BALAC2494_01682 [Bifidobacterium animalis subsp. lactis CNCM I-2494]|uniref:Uncharacterized protein n=1 Tax=Bifidobacterium animalis subsp. lactis CNCM I-2494 TaxID=1042403 RepID=A0A806FG06_BIFAN|nr:hypothetical protein BALAC2494_01682 [Bifidobacterium animalis subsp. lactis CNCM I-2494]